MKSTNSVSPSFSPSTIAPPPSLTPSLLLSILFSPSLTLLLYDPLLPPLQSLLFYNPLLPLNNPFSSTILFSPSLTHSLIQVPPLTGKVQSIITWRWHQVDNKEEKSKKKRTRLATATKHQYRHPCSCNSSCWLYFPSFNYEHLSF